MNHRRTPAWLLWSALLAWACAILSLSALRPDELPEAAFLFSDKINHAAAYALGGWLAAAALRASMASLDATRTVTLAVVIIAAFGLVDESLQTLTPGRSGADVYDWSADVSGALIGALLCAGIHRLSCRRTSKESQ